VSTTLVGSFAKKTEQNYRQLARAAKRNPVRDKTHVWETYTPISEANGVVRDRIRWWCGTKGIQPQALEAMGTRYKIDSHGGVALAWCGRAREGFVCAIRYRDLAPDGRRACEPGSAWPYPCLYGNLDSDMYLICEGETDAAALLWLTNYQHAIVCLSAGALAQHQALNEVIPVGVRVLVVLDYDEPSKGYPKAGGIGEHAARKIMRLLPGSKRLRPLDKHKDWCEWLKAQKGASGERA
jgi:hypothetical protein